MIRDEMAYGVPAVVGPSKIPMVHYLYAWIVRVQIKGKQSRLGAVGDQVETGCLDRYETSIHAYDLSTV
jgi:hypothetical protein